MTALWLTFRTQMRTIGFSCQIEIDKQVLQRVTP